MDCTLLFFGGLFLGGVVGAFLEWVFLLPYIRR
jgi:hypothetical protein